MLEVRNFLSFEERTKRNISEKCLVNINFKYIKYVLPLHSESKIPWPRKSPAYKVHVTDITS